MARLIWCIGQYVQSNNAISAFQWSAQIYITIFETEKSHYKSGNSISSCTSIRSGEIYSTVPTRKEARCSIGVVIITIL